MQNDKIKVAFLDRDGVINKEINYLYKVEDFEYTVNCIEGLKCLNSLGYEIVIVTNQAGIGKGFYNEDDYIQLTEWYINNLELEGIKILDVFYCPHHEEAIYKKYKVNCRCRKPKPGMLLEAACKYNIDINKSIMVGDKVSDLEAGKAAGILKSNLFLVSTGHKIIDDSIWDYKIMDDLKDVSSYLNKRELAV